MKNIKKIRGWKRQINKLKSYATEMMLPNVKAYDIFGHTYFRFLIDPWYRLIKRNPPVWFFKLMIIHLGNIFDQWEQFFSDRNEPFDLQIWIFTKTFNRSEIYCAKVDENGEERNFFQIAKIQKKFPNQMFGFEIEEKLAWTLCDDIDYSQEDELVEIYGSLANITDKKYTLHVRANGTKYYTRKIGEVWVGRRKRKTV